MSDGRINVIATLDDKDYNRKIENMKKGVDALETTTLKMTEKQQKAYERLARTISENKDALKTATDPTQIALYNKRLDEANVKMARLVATASKPMPAVSGKVTPYNSQGNTIAQMQDALGSFKDRLVGERDINNVRQLNRNIQDLETNIKRTTNAGKKGFDDMGNAIPEKKVSSFGRLFTNITASFGIFAGVGSVVSLITSFFDTMKQMQTLNKAMELGAKDSIEYASNIDFLKRVTNDYGLELVKTTEAYNKFYIASKNKLSINEIQSMFESVSKSASIMGLSIADQDGIFRALEQMMSKGTVQAEELRGQLGDRLPGAFEVMANSMGVTTAELSKLMQDGKVVASEVLPNFAKELEKTFGAENISRVETLTAEQNRLKNSWTEFVTSVDNGEGVIAKAFIGLTKLGTAFIDLISPSNALSKNLKDEQLNLNVLVGEITTANTTNARRLELISELKKNYPEFLALIGEEEISNKNLLDALDKTNESYRERIRLQLLSEDENDILKDREKITRMSLVAENNLYERLNELNLKYNLGLTITKDNLQETANQLQQVGKNNLSIWETSSIEYYQHTLLRLLPALDKVNQKYNDFKANNRVTFTANESISEEKRLMFEEKRIAEFEAKKNRITTNSNNTAVKKAENTLDKRLSFIDELNKAENNLTQSTLSGLDLELSKVNEVYNERIKKAKELKANQSTFDKIESLKTQETEIVVYKNETEGLKATLEAQKKDYEDFEAYKKQVGVAKAKEMYSGILDVSKNYYQVLEDEINTFNGKDNLTASEKERLNILTKMYADYSVSKNEEDRKALQELYAMTQTFEQRILVLREEYEKRRKELVNNPEALAELEKQFTGNIRQMINSFADENGIGTAITESVIGATKEIIIAQIDSLRDFLKNTNDLTKEQVKEIEKTIKGLDNSLFKSSDNGNVSAIKLINNTIKSLNNDLKSLEERKSFLESLNLPETKVEIAKIDSSIKGITVQIDKLAKSKARALTEEFANISGIFNNIAQDVEGMGGGFSKIFTTLSKISNIAGSVTNMFASVKEFSDAQKSDEGASFTQGLSAFGGIMSAVFGLTGMITGALDAYEKAQDEASQRRIQSYISSLEFERELLAIETERIRRNAISISDRQKEADSVGREIALKIKQLDEIQAKLDSFSVYYLMSEMNLWDFSAMFGDVEDLQALYDTLKQMRDLGQEMTQEQKDQLSLLDAFWLGGRSWQELQQVLNNLTGKYLNDEMRASVEQAIKLSKELEEAGYTLEDVQNMMRELSTGTSMDELSNALADAFRNGEDAVMSFGETIEEVLKNAIISSFKNEFIVKEMDKFFKLFGDMGAGGYTEEELNEIRRLAKEMAERLQIQWDAMGGVLDQFDFGSEDLGGSAKDGIKRITEKQADRLTGILTGMQVDTIESRKSLQLSVNLLSSSLDNLVAIEYNTRRTADGVYEIKDILQNNQNQALGL